MKIVCVGVGGGGGGLIPMPKSGEGNILGGQDSDLTTGGQLYQNLVVEVRNFIFKRCIVRFRILNSNIIGCLLEALNILSSQVPQVVAKITKGLFGWGLSAY